MAGRVVRSLLPLCMAPLTATVAADEAPLLDTLRDDGTITHTHYEQLEREGQAATDGSEPTLLAAKEKAPASTKSAAARSGHGGKGYTLTSADGRFETQLQWRAQLRFSHPFDGDPRQGSDFDEPGQTSFDIRRARIKVGGHAYQPWLKYFFELDLQPLRNANNAASDSAVRLLDFRIDLARWSWGELRLGQWKIDYNRERVDSSAAQQFVERSIVNRPFTIDRQVGVQLRGRANEGTRADIRWYAGVFTGEGRGTRNTDNNLLYAGRLQWNLLGRDVALRQTDVEFSERPAVSIGLGVSTATGACTRWSSAGCGNLDGFASPSDAATDQFDVDQFAQDFIFKRRGLSIQQEYHRKNVADRVVGTDNTFDGGFIQAGYFFHTYFPRVPRQLELAARYATLNEPNAMDRMMDNERREFSVAANWFFNQHNNKLTLDMSRLTLDDPVLNRSDSELRVRLQWDVTF